MGTPLCPNARHTLPKETIPWRTEGRQKKSGRIDKNLSKNVSFKSFDTNPEFWEETAQDRSAWRHLRRKSASNYEKHRIAEAKGKRMLQTSRANLPSPTPSIVQRVAEFSEPESDRSATARDTPSEPAVMSLVLFDNDGRTNRRMKSDYLKWQSF